MDNRISGLDLAGTRDRIRALTRQGEKLARQHSEGPPASLDEVNASTAEALSRVNNLKADLAAAQDEVYRIKASLAEARGEHNRLRHERAKARLAARTEPAELSAVKQELLGLQKTRNDQAKQLLNQGEPASDVADFSGLSLPRVYQIRNQ